jgi:hypothetical protein
VDAADHLTAVRERLSGAKDARDRETVAASLKRCEDLAAKLRPRGGATAAVAIDELAERILALDALSTATADPAADLTRAVDLAEEAYKLAPSSNTRAVAQAARLARGVRQVRRADRGFDAYCVKYLRATSTFHVVAAAIAAGPAPARQALLADADIQRTVALMRESLSAFPDDPTVAYWPILRAADPAAADALAAKVRATPRLPVGHSISGQLRPADAGEALETFWLMQILGKPQDGRAAIDRVTAQGIPVPPVGEN